MNREAKASGHDRASFLARVSAALERKVAKAPTSPAPYTDDAIARVASPGPEMVSLFASRAKETGMVVHRIDQATFTDWLSGFVFERGANRVVVAGVAGLAAVATALRDRGVEAVTWPAADGVEGLFHVDIGITDVQGAIAETGTLVCWSGPHHGRGLSLVPPIHIAVVRGSDIVPDLIDYLARHAQVAGERLPSSVVFITGPSKTADIEGVLITGMHGPREVHIVLVDDV